MPASISAPMAASVNLSTVHHHSAKGVRCVRETITIPRTGGTLIVLTRHGLRSINGAGAGAPVRCRGGACPRHFAGTATAVPCRGAIMAAARGDGLFDGGNTV